MGRRRCGDTCGHGAETEDRLARCAAYSRPTAGEPVPADLDSLPGRAGSATAVAAPPQDGLPTNIAEKPVACAGHGPGRLSKKEVVDGWRTDRTRCTGIGSLGESATAGAIGDTGPAGSIAGGAGSGGRQRSGATSGRPQFDGATGSRAGHRFDVR